MKRDQVRILEYHHASCMMRILIIECVSGTIIFDKEVPSSECIQTRREAFQLSRDLKYEVVQ